MVYLANLSVFCVWYILFSNENTLFFFLLIKIILVPIFTSGRVFLRSSGYACKLTTVFYFLVQFAKYDEPSVRDAGPTHDRNYILTLNFKWFSHFFPRMMTSMFSNNPHALQIKPLYCS
jgi:hypothetical protein